MRTIFLALTFFSIAFLWSCNKDDIDLEEGTYKGVFTVTYSSGVQTGETSIELKNGRYSCSGNSNRVPAGGFGTYSLKRGKITFYDEGFWTADFDWNLILNGQYNYTFNGKRLKISAIKNGVGHYKYDLEKQ